VSTSTLITSRAKFSGCFSCESSETCKSASVSTDELKDKPLLTASRKKRHEGTLWQRRFWEHQIRDETDFVRHVDYIHWNPVKHGHVRQAAEWPYWTFHRYVRSGVYAEDWSGVPNVSGDFGE
jgi:putative transposase